MMNYQAFRYAHHMLSTHFNAQESINYGYNQLSEKPQKLPESVLSLSRLTRSGVCRAQYRPGAACRQGSS